jgi:ABC-type Fe3+ transport system permease subunit
MTVADTIAMIALVVAILIAIYIAANLYTVTNAMGLTGAANTTAEQVFTNTWTGLTLASIGIIITAAVGLLALVLGTLGRAAGGVAT